jgi:hypothetical protein
MNIFGDHILSLEVIQLQKTILLFFIPILGEVFQSRFYPNDSAIIISLSEKRINMCKIVLYLRLRASIIPRVKDV